MGWAALSGSAEGVAGVPWTSAAIADGCVSRERRFARAAALVSPRTTRSRPDPITHSVLPDRPRPADSPVPSASQASAGYYAPTATFLAEKKDKNPRGPGESRGACRAPRGPDVGPVWPGGGYGPPPPGRPFVPAGPGRSHRSRALQRLVFTGVDVPARRSRGGDSRLRRGRRGQRHAAVRAASRARPSGAELAPVGPDDPVRAGRLPGRPGTQRRSVARRRARRIPRQVPPRAAR